VIHAGTCTRELHATPYKSMAGSRTESAMLGWHGLDGDRRFAFRRIDRRAERFPWLSASKLPELDCSTSHRSRESSGESLPTHVRTPSGSQLELGSDELNAEIGTD
jgi:uncharacterized protein YcbX